MKKIVWTSIFAAFAFSSSNIVFAQDSSTTIPPPSGSNTTMQQPTQGGMLPPPNGTIIQKPPMDGTKTDAQRMLQPGMMQNGRPGMTQQNQTQIKGSQENSEDSTEQEAKMTKAQQTMMKRAAKQITTNLKNLTKAQTKVKKVGLALSSDCETVISDAKTLTEAITSGSDEYDQDDVSETMHNIGNCIVISKQLQQVPNIYKTLSKAAIRFKKNNPEENIDSEVSVVETEYATIKGGDFSDDDLQEFFDDSRNLAETINYNIGKLGIPQNAPTQNNGGGMMNQGAAVMEGIGSYFINLFK